jgi:hypothetical protein
MKSYRGISNLFVIGQKISSRRYWSEDIGQKISFRRYRALHMNTKMCYTHEILLRNFKFVYNRSEDIKQKILVRRYRSEDIGQNISVRRYRELQIKTKKCYTHEILSRNFKFVYNRAEDIGQKISGTSREDKKVLLLPATLYLNKSCPFKRNSIGMLRWLRRYKHYANVPQHFVYLH